MNQYIEAIRQAMILFPIIAVLFTIPYVIHNYHKYGSLLSMRILIVYSFVLYMICVYCLVILPLPTGETLQKLHGHKMQLVPFMFVADIIKESSVTLSDPKSYLTLINNPAVLTNLFNIFMTIPFGIYLRYYFRKNAVQTLCFSFLLTLFFELTQLSGLYFIYPGSYRLFDVDDLIMNTTGGMAGYLLAGPLMKFLPSREEIDHMSYVHGQKISVVRRMLAFLYDIFFAAIFYAIIGVLLYIVGFSSKWVTFTLTEMLYFMLCPMILKGCTIGHRLTKLRIEPAEGKEKKWYRYLIRYGSLFLVIHYLPMACADAVAALSELTDSPVMVRIVFLGIGFGIFCFFLFFEFIRMAMKKTLFYERLSGTVLTSTVTKDSHVG